MGSFGLTNVWYTSLHSSLTTATRAKPLAPSSFNNNHFCTSIESSRIPEYIARLDGK